MTKLPELPLLGKVAAARTSYNYPSHSTALRNDTWFQHAKTWRSINFQPQLERLEEVDNERSVSENRHFKLNRRTLLQRLKKCPTTTMSLDEIKTHKILTKTKDGYIQSASIGYILDLIDLLTICNVVRTKPTTSNEKHYGYTEGYQGIHNGRTHYVGLDDIYRFHNNFRRVFLTTHAAIDSSFTNLKKNSTTKTAFEYFTIWILISWAAHSTMLCAIGTT